MISSTTPIGASTTAARRETSDAIGKASASVAKPMRRSSNAASVAGSSGAWALWRIMRSDVWEAPPGESAGHRPAGTLAAVSRPDCRCGATLRRHFVRDSDSLRTLA